jgi:hypothetical protein
MNRNSTHFKIEASSILSSIVAAHTGKPTSLFDRASALIQSGFYAGSVSNIKSQLISGDNSPNNLLNPLPKSLIYPKAASSDPLYDVLELKLRAAIRIPLTFTYGRKPPVILVPGTPL